MTEKTTQNQLQLQLSQFQSNYPLPKQSFILFTAIFAGIIGRCMWATLEGVFSHGVSVMYRVVLPTTGLKMRALTSAPVAVFGLHCTNGNIIVAIAVRCFVRNAAVLRVKYPGWESENRLGCVRVVLWRWRMSDKIGNLLPCFCVPAKVDCVWERVLVVS